MSATARLLAYRNTLRVSVIVFVIALVSIPLDTLRYGWWPLGAGALLHAIEAAVLGIALWRTGPRWSVKACDVAYAALLAPYLVTIWLPQVFDHQAGILAEPMIAHHFVLLGIAILPPHHFRWGLVLLGVFTAHALGLWITLEGVGMSRSLEREPWFTLLFAGISVGLMWSSWRRHDLSLRLARAEARADALDQFNRVMLALRDRANTPLQTLELSIAVLEREATELAPSLATMRRAISQLVAAQEPVSRAAVNDSTSPLHGVDLDRELRELGAPPPTREPHSSGG